jgi:pilus assembly protein CpaF
MVAMGSVAIPEKTVRMQIASAIAIVVQVSRMSDGTRKVTNISEIVGMEENVVSMQEIFRFNRKGVGPDGKVVGSFQPTQIRPKFLERLRIAGIFLSPGLFEQTLEVN